MMNKNMKNMEIKEEALENVAGGISQEMIIHLLETRDKVIKMWQNGEIPFDAYTKLINNIDEMLRSPGCAA